jgi:hypothetical protein
MARNVVILYVNPAARIVFTEGDRIYPITAFLDDEGEVMIESPLTHLIATWCVAGSGTEWLTVDLKAFAKDVTH